MLKVRDLVIYLPNGESEYYHTGKLPCHNNSVKARKLWVSTSDQHAVVQLTNRERYEYCGLPFCIRVLGKEPNND